MSRIHHLGKVSVLLRKSCCSLCGRTSKLPWLRALRQSASARMCSSKTTHDSSTPEETPNLEAGPESGIHTGGSGRYNAVHIQMISENIHGQVFKDTKCSESQVVGEEELKKIVSHLKAFDLWDKKAETLENVDFQLPPVSGKNVDEHFRQLASAQNAPYVAEIDKLMKCSIPKRPKKWAFQKGWTRYDPDSGKPQSVLYPEEQGIVFDVEVLVKEGNFPTLATAVSSKAWYSWCSGHLIQNQFSRTTKRTSLDDLVPMETGPSADVQQWLPRLVIGHNVGYDRSFIKEQYFIQGTKLRFLDTMSMHIAISGLTSLQRILYMANKTGSRRKEVVEHEHDRAMFGGAASTDWIKKSTLNNLNDVYQLYCKGEPLDKATRNVFVEGTVEDVRNDFQNLMNYCASDVSATLGVFKKIWPQFQERFPHPVTSAGMLEMGSAYLPVNRNWEAYIDQAQKTFDDLQQEMNQLLQRLANDACALLKDEKYKEDVWLWDLDWSVRNLKYRKVKKPKKKKTDEAEDPVQQMTDAAQELAAKQPHMPGYPRWYADLHPKDAELKGGAAPGPSKITTQQRITPKLLNLTWDGYPLHYDSTHGWGYLVPQVYRDDEEEAVEKELDRQEFGDEEEETDEEKRDKKKVTGPSANDFPQKSLLEAVAQTRPEWVKRIFGHKTSQLKADELLEKVHNSTGEENNAEVWAHYKEVLRIENSKPKKAPVVKSDPAVSQPGVGPYTDVIPGCDFYKLPHKDGSSKRVGNPLAKDFLSKIEEGILRSRSGDDAEIVLKCSKMCSYWKNNMDRIRSQMAVYMKPEELPEAITSNEDFDEDGVYGAILPRVVSAGTVTRRAVESTWLTASNAYTDRVGSELKAMIQTPPGYHFVGADVDSQELWIASILGDAYFAGIHGCTALSWMTLQGNKADGTDMHSHIAALVGISRDQAKIFNYGRIYGAGVRFAEQLLRQFNHRLTSQEAKRKAKVMYESTKGKKIKFLHSEEDLDEADDYVGHQWSGGSESAMFNMLEKIAVSKEPRTPVLGCKISKTLEPKNVADDFMTSRVNWVVQSSAVDYLHLMLVCMRWLFEKFDIDGRFCISIHDEVRYLVRSEDRYRAALALQITNLLTRSMFAYKLGMEDLPQSVAFFSAVDIDSCLRKEVVMDCVTPSNPRGLAVGYGIPQGEALIMKDILEKTNQSLVVVPPSDQDVEDLDSEDILLFSQHLI